MGAPMDWNDLRYLLAVADHGSTLAAGRALGVSQTTVARRIAALEVALGHPLFDKRQAGYALTPDARPCSIGPTVSALPAIRQASPRLPRLTDVRITTQEIFCQHPARADVARSS